jgi:hypothetical protein
MRNLLIIPKFYHNVEALAERYGISDEDDLNMVRLERITEWLLYRYTDYYGPRKPKRRIAPARPCKACRCTKCTGPVEQAYLTPF